MFVQLGLERKARVHAGPELRPRAARFQGLVPGRGADFSHRQKFGVSFQGLANGSLLAETPTHPLGQERKFGVLTTKPAPCP